MIKAGEVAFLKTTGEAVFVLAITDEGVSVRRPVYAQNFGNQHNIEVFTLPEFETQDEQQARFIAERQKVMTQFGPKTEQPTTPDHGFSTN